MKISTDIEDARWATLTDVEATVARAITAVLPSDPRSVDILLTHDAEMRLVNKQWRGKDTSTNILSFPSPDMPVPSGEVAHLGDLVLAWETVEREAREAQKPMGEHVVHLIVHGVLHLIGHDHENEADGDLMEARETEILAGLGIADPYRI